MYSQVRALNCSLWHSQWYQIRSIAQVNTKTAEGGVPSPEWVNAKPMTEMPGPTKFGLIRGFLPGGVFHNMSAIEFTLAGRELYGDIYLMPGVFGKKSIVMSFNPDDFPVAHRSEGVWPRRRGFESLNYHRRVHKGDAFGGVIALLGSNDEDWGKIRSAVNPVLMQPRNARLYVSKMLEVNDEFLQRIREIRDQKTLEMPDNFDDEIKRLTFESVAVVALNKQIGLIRKNRNSDEAKKIFEGLQSMFELILQLDVYPSVWKYIKTPKFRQMMKSCDTLYDITMKYINEALDRIENDTSSRNENEEKSVLEKLVKIDKRIAVVMAMDMIMAGVDTTTSSLAGILLCIAKNPEKQEKLRQEIRTILPKKDSPLTVDNMKNLPYLRACIKEGIRIYPIGAGTLRTNAEDIIMSGYRIPKGQEIVLNSNLLLLEDKYYPRAKEFIPERWLRGAQGDQLPKNPFMYTPFGFGARSCVGKRLVEIELEITVARLVRNFYMEFNYSTEKAFKDHMINVPVIPLKFKMSEVES